MAFRLIRCLARAAVKNAGNLLGVIPGAEFVWNVAHDCWDFYQEHRQINVLREELQKIAVASFNEIQEEVRLAIQAEAGRQPAQVQQAMKDYLTQVPAMIRRSLRRPSDPTGTSLPSTVSLNQARDLIPFLPPRPPRFHAGQRPLAGVDWELEELLGIGGFGEVWKARHRYMKSERPIALKFCLDESAVKSLRNEVGLLDVIRGQGRHPGIVPLLHTYLNASTPCIAYEYISGGDLTGLIQELSENGKLTAGLATQMIRQLAKTVGFFHLLKPPVVHSDLKPCNILVQQTSKGKTILRIADFGIGGVVATQAMKQTKSAKSTRQQLLTDAVRGACTPLYASPQQMQRHPGDLPDPRDDVHALGIIWYQLVTGDLSLVDKPTDWRDEVQNCGLSSDLADLLGSCIASREEKRPVNAHELLDRLSALSLSSGGSASTKQPIPVKRRGTRPIPTAKARSSPQPVTRSPSRLPGQTTRQGIPASTKPMSNSNKDIDNHLEMAVANAFKWNKYILTSALAGVGLFVLLIFVASYFVFAPTTTTDVDSTHSNTEVVRSKQQGSSKGKAPFASKHNSIPNVPSGSLKGHYSQVASIAFSAAGKLLASGGSDCDIRLWTLPTGKCCATLQGHSGTVQSVVFSPDGKTLASFSADKTIKLWRIPSGNSYATLKGSRGVFSPDGNIFASVNATKTSIELWTTSTGNNFASLSGHSKSVGDVTFSPEGKILASCSKDKTVMLWRIPSGEKLATLQGHSGGVGAVNFSPDGKILASTSEDKTIKLWSMPSGSILKTLDYNYSYMTRVTFSHDGTTMASPTSDMTIKLWKIPSGDNLATLKGTGYVGGNLAFNCDGKIVVSCGFSEKIIRLWNLELYNKPWATNYANLIGHSEAINDIAISPDGTTIASASTDKTIRLWRIPDTN